MSTSMFKKGDKVVLLKSSFYTELADMEVGTVYTVHQDEANDNIMVATVKYPTGLFYMANDFVKYNTVRRVIPWL